MEPSYLSLNQELLAARNFLRVKQSQLFWRSMSQVMPLVSLLFCTMLHELRLFRQIVNLYYGPLTAKHLITLLKIHPERGERSMKVSSLKSKFWKAWTNTRDQYFQMHLLRKSSKQANLLLRPEKRAISSIWLKKVNASPLKERRVKK